MRICTGVEPVSNTKHGQHKCTQCDQVFKKISRMEKHMKARHPEPDKRKNRKRLTQYERRGKQKVIKTVKKRKSEEKTKGRHSMEQQRK